MRPSPAATVEGVGARLWQAEAVQLLPGPPGLGPMQDSAITVSHFRIGLDIIRSVSAESRNSGSSFPDFSSPILPARLFADRFLWMIFLKGTLGDLSVGVDCVWTRLLRLGTLERSDIEVLVSQSATCNEN